MKKLIVLGALIAVAAAAAFPQVQTVTVKIRAIMVDGDLNQKPVPRLALALVRSDNASTGPIVSRTGFDGTAELQLPPGNYRLSTPEPLDFQGKRYSWEIDVTVSLPEAVVVLSNDNAKISDSAPLAPARQVDDLASLFKKYRNSVVTVWSEFGHGTGFIVDQTGLILTNQHVVGPSEYIAVQFDEKRKVEAKLVAFDPEKDIAVLWATLHHSRTRLLRRWLSRIRERLRL